MKRNVLITGFEPFGGGARNPSAEIAQALHGSRIYGREVCGVVLPVAFGRSGVCLKQAIKETDPELVICLGLAGSRRSLSLERVAVNLDDAAIPDNAGQQPIDTPVVRGGPTAYLTTLPVKRIAAALIKREVPVELSSTAGNYVCNHVFYHLMHQLRRRPGVRGGFIHVPPYSAGFEHEVMREALAAAILQTLRSRNDLKIPAGKID